MTDYNKNEDREYESSGMERVNQATDEELEEWKKNHLRRWERGLSVKKHKNENTTK